MNGTDRREFLKGAAAAAGIGAWTGCATRRVASAGGKGPGWIDLQVNGRYGIAFNSPKITVDEVVSLTERLRDEGTTGYLAAMSTTSAGETQLHTARVIAEARRKSATCAESILGLHLEGPFVSREKGYVGAHNPAMVRDPDIGYVDKVNDACGGLVRMVTIATEAKGAEAFTRAATDRGICVSIGHSAEWRPERIGALVEAGAKSFTHLGNGLPDLIHRRENVIWTALAEDRMSIQFIPDGFHLTLQMLRVYTRAVPLKRLVAVSDCAYPGGLKPGRYEMDGDVHLLEPDGFIRSLAGTLHGSSSNMAQVMRVLNSPYVGLSEADCRVVGCDNPLRLIGQEGRL